MNRAAEWLTKYNDFTSFAKLNSDNKTNICHIVLAEWKLNSESELVFKIRADRFLRNMVRAIVGTLVDVGRGKITSERFREIIEARDLSLASGGAPAHGLFLTDIKYSNLKL
jgi:tRNA pseudouridine38-40 synthase